METTPLGALIASGREAMGLSRPALARQLLQRLNVVADQSWIARIENGSIARPDRPRLEALAAYLGLDMDLVLRRAGYLPESEAAELVPPDIAAMLSAWEPWELEVLRHELPTLRAMYRRVKVLVNPLVSDESVAMESLRAVAEPVETYATLGLPQSPRGANTPASSGGRKQEVSDDEVASGAEPVGTPPAGAEQPSGQLPAHQRVRDAARANRDARPPGTGHR